MVSVLVLTFCLASLVQTAPQKGTKTFRDVPTGHCEPSCSCEMGGLYYSVGEQWSKSEDPCTVYKCSTNGVIDKVKKGCLFKEKCRPVDSTWTEGCNTFTCIEHTNITLYKLIEAGCPVSAGDCLKVGQRRNSGCDVVECQVDGERLVTKTIRTDCSADGTCKRIGSYWHDGCTIFTCAKEGGVAAQHTLRNEVMQWPEGNYALPKPKSGCPTDVPTSWSEGSRKHYGAGRNFFSDSLSLAGNYTEEYMKHEFCVHRTSAEIAELPRYKTYWEPGSYCILRHNGICPRGFSDGYVAFDDNDSRSKSVSTGTVPDGEYTAITGLYFCCRKDGSVKSEIVLPKERSFILFTERGQGECQKVKGMSHSTEFLSFDGLLTSKHEKRGHTPSVKIADGDVTLSFCHYKPKECGCTDESGRTIAVNMEKEIDCVVKKCLSENGKNVLKTLSGGCPVNGKCQPEGSTWSVTEGDTCRFLTCERVVDSSAQGASTTFKIRETATGCRDGVVCKTLGSEIHRGCYTSRCMVDAVSNTTTFKVLKADCPWLDTCKAPNSTWDYNCMTYRRDMTTESGHYQWNVQPVQYGCSDGKGNCYKVGENVSGQCYDAVCKLSENKTVVYLDVTKGGCTWRHQCKDVNDTWLDGCHRFTCEWIDTDAGFTAIVNATNVSCDWNKTCYKEDDVWSDGCIQYKCVVSREAGTVNWSVNTVSLACKDLNGKCLPVGQEFVQNCVTYRCRHKGDQIGLDPVSVGCSWNHTCYPENERWNDTVKCVEYQCLKQILPMGAVMQVSVVGYGCVFNDTCMAVNSTWPDGCRTRKCIVHRRNKIIQRTIAPISAGCDDEGICRNVGYKKITDTCMEYQCIFNDTYKDSFFSLVGGGCRSTDRKCHDVGTAWMEKQENTCLNYVCQKEQLGYLSKMVQQQCLDAQGKCRDVGSIGFQANVQGQLRTNCSCVLSTTNVSGIGITCTG